MLEAAGSALSSLLDPGTLVFLGAGILAGLVIGIIPGLGGTGAVAILLPFIFVLEPDQALALMIGAVAVVHTSDTIASVLMGIPGSASATVLMLDGHEMAKQGMAARALAIAFLSSMFGGLLGALGLTLSIPIARPLVLSFGSPELFMLTVLGISITALLSKGNMIKGLLAGAFGLLLGQIGGAPAAPDYRFTFDSLFLTEGLDLVAVALGIFGVAEVVSRVAKKTSVATGAGIGKGWSTGIKDVFSNFSHVLRGALVGIWAGVLPGLGATAGTWMAYGQAKATAKGSDRKKFGKGDPRGIIAPESANNSVEAGDLIPTLLFGIPGGAPAALLLGALLIFGIEPGPRIIEDNLDTVYLIVWSFAIASVIGAALCFVLAGPLARLSFVRFPVLAGALIVILFLAGYQDSKQIQLLLVMLVLGFVGWLMKIARIPRAPFLIGFVLAVPLERYYYLTANLYSPSEWLVRPAVIVMIIILLIPVVMAVIRRVRARRDPDVPQLMPDDDDDDEGGESAEPPSIWRIVIAAAFLVIFAGALVLAQDFSANAKLVPTLVTGLGVILSIVVLIIEIKNRKAVDKGSDRAEWSQELRWVATSFAWIVGFIVLVYILGMLLAAIVFLPIFLRLVAEMKWWHIAIYTVAVVAVMLVLREIADVAIPIGYLTPVGLLGVV
ncbi:MAG: tripartite tricarboxylate transporter permease [Actinomycetaceae bacterium]